MISQLIKQTYEIMGSIKAKQTQIIKSIYQSIKQTHEIMGSIKQANPDHKIHESIKQTHVKIISQ